MKTKNIFFAIFTLLLAFTNFGQTAKVTGVILDENNQPVEGVNVSYLTKSSITDFTGSYLINVPANQKVILVFTHVSLNQATLTIPKLKPDENFEFNVVLSNKAEQMGEVVIINNRKRIQGITSLEPEMIRKMVGANAGIENVLKLLGGVNSNNELSTQYSVRGGNYDENLVYVNEDRKSVV